MNYYELLEVSSNASTEVIQNAYRALSRKYHPDVYEGDKIEAEEKMKLLNEAYSVLSDKQKRKKYDEDLSKNNNHQNKDSEQKENVNISKDEGLCKEKNKPLFIFRWLFICLTLFVSLMFDTPICFYVSLCLTISRIIISHKYPCIKVKGFKKFMCILIIGVLILSNCGAFFFESSDIATNDSSSTSNVPAEITAELTNSDSKDLEENALLDSIADFEKSIIKNDRKLYIKCYLPEMYEKISNSTKNTGYSTMYLGNSVSGMINYIIINELDINVKMNNNGVESKIINEDIAIIYVNYSIEFETDEYLVYEPNNYTIEYTLNKEKKWYVSSFKEVSEAFNPSMVTDGFNIVEATDFSDGVAFIKCQQLNEDFRTFSIDTKGNILCEWDSNKNFDGYTGYENGILVIGDDIYNKKGEKIASPELLGYDSIYEISYHSEYVKNLDGYVIVTKYVEAFEGDKRLAGIINNLGEWEIPLSVEGEWIHNGIKYKWYQHEDAEYSTTPTVQISSQHYECVENSIYVIDINGNSTELLQDFQCLKDIKEKEWFLEEVFIGRPIVWDEDNFEYVSGSYSLYDYSGNIIIDLSKYNINGYADIYYNNGYLLFTAFNSSGDLYLCFVDSRGNDVFPPIKLGEGTYYSELNDKGFVCLLPKSDHGNKCLYFYDYNGNTMEYKDFISFDGFNDGLALVENSAGQLYYIDYEGNIIVK